MVKISKLLKSDGEAVICYDSRQFVQLCTACERAGLRVVEVQFVHSKEDRPSTLVMLHLKKNSKAALTVLPPMITEANGAYSPAVQTIYDKAKVHSIKCPMY
jgi:tRNA1(Val) A37 N6-methylase TrmN6